MDSRQVRFFACDLFRWAEYTVAVLAVIILGLSLYGGMYDLSGLEGKIEDLLKYDDAAIYDWPTEEEFVTWLLEDTDVAYTRSDIERHRKAYRYLHSFEATRDSWMQTQC